MKLNWLHAVELLVILVLCYFLFRKPTVIHSGYDAGEKIIAEKKIDSVRAVLSGKVDSIQNLLDIRNSSEQVIASAFLVAHYEIAHLNDTLGLEQFNINTESPLHIFK